MNVTGRIYCGNHDSSAYRQLQIPRRRGLVWLSIVSFAISQELTTRLLTCVSLLTACTCQLAYGSIYQLFSLKWVYLCAIVLFEIGSVISAAAQTSSVFIAGRAISGIGFAGINCGSLM
jgi:MFS family permease